MAFGLIPQHSITCQLAGPREHFLVLALETSARLGWPIHYISATGIVALIPAPRASQLTLRIDTETATVTATSVSRKFFDRRGRNREAVMLFIDTLSELAQTTPAEQLVARYEDLQRFLPPPHADALLYPSSKTGSQGADVMAIFRPVPGYFITPIILNLNILIFTLMALSGVSIVTPDSTSLINWGANLRPLTTGGEWWRLLTSTFLHIGGLHLFMNMYALLLIGAQLEPRLGKGRFFAAYIVTGIVASFTSIMWHERTISAGASGAIFGMYGVFLALLSTDIVTGSNKKQLLASILFFVVYNLLSGLQPGIDNAAHVGGLLSGMIIGYSFIPHLRKLAVKEAATVAEPIIKEELPDYY